jgi:hypothetical protein
MHPKTDLNWLLQECDKANSLTELFEVAFRELLKFPGECKMVCGPISTGGLGDSKLNLAVFNAVIRKLLHRRQHIWSQMPYEGQIFRFRERWWNENPERRGDYYMPILEEFYRPLIRMRHFKQALFIPGWSSSFGACWEREEFAALNIPRKNIKSDWMVDIYQEVLGRSTP